jgi:hypothetical protein
MGQRTAVDELKLAPDRDAMGDAGDIHIQVLQLFSNVVSRCLTFYRGVCCQYQLTHLSAFYPFKQLIKPQIFRANPVNGGQMPLKDKIHTVEPARLFYSDQVYR